jgi:hypothetical protein
MGCGTWERDRLHHRPLGDVIARVDDYSGAGPETRQHFDFVAEVTHGVLDLAEDPLRLLDTSSRWCPDVQPQLSRIDRGKKSWPTRGNNSSEPRAKPSRIATVSNRWFSAQPSSPW